MATDWTNGKSGSYEFGTDSGNINGYWASCQLNWQEQYSPSTGLHRIIITPKARNSSVNYFVGENAYLGGTVKINGTTVYDMTNYNVAVCFYSTGTWYSFSDATDSYNTETWTSPEFTGSCEIVCDLRLMVYTGSSYWNYWSNTTTLSASDLTPTGSVRIYTSSGWQLAQPYIWSGSAWAPAQAHIWNGSSWQACG